MDLNIFWNHVGREHGGLHYTEDIRKNSTETIQNCLELKERRCETDPLGRYVRLDINTLLELPTIHNNKKYLIVYDLKNGLQYSLNFKSKYPWWVIDIVDIVEIKPNVFCSYDLFIDISVHKDGSYKVLDIDEYEEALRLNVMSQEQISKSLKSFHHALSILNTNSFPYPLLVQLEKQYM